jgi:hypothetical protein
VPPCWSPSLSSRYPSCYPIMQLLAGVWSRYSCPWHPCRSLVLSFDAFSNPKLLAVWHDRRIRPKKINPCPQAVLASP